MIYIIPKIWANSGTVSFWWYTKQDQTAIVDQNTSPALFQLGGYYGNSSFTLWAYHNVGNEPYLKFYIKGQSNAGWSGSPAVKGSGTGWYHKNAWQFIAVAWRQGKYFDVYVDDSLILNNYGPIADPITSFSNNNLMIGYNSGGGKTNGNFDEVRAYNRALTATEVVAIYNATK